MTPDGAHLLNAYDAECTYLLNTYDAKLHQGQSISLEAYIFVTNRCGATSNTSPDSHQMGIHSTPFCHKAKSLKSDGLPLVRFGVICVQKVGAFGIICIQQVAAIWRHMQFKTILVRPQMLNKCCRGG